MDTNNNYVDIVDDNNIVIIVISIHAVGIVRGEMGWKGQRGGRGGISSFE